MVAEGLRPRVKQLEDDYAPEGVVPFSIWPFQLRDEEDAILFEAGLTRGFNGVELKILGTPQATKPGVRWLGPIVEMAQTMKNMQVHGLGEPQPVVFCPVYINAWANGADAKKNYQAAELYLALAKSYFEVFHSKLTPPQLQTDNETGIAMMAQIAAAIKDKLSPSTLEKLIAMAKNHTDLSQAELETRVAGYLAAHYAVYGEADLPGYVLNGKPTVFLTPPSEEVFHGLMVVEWPSLQIDLPPVSQKQTCVGYSQTLTAPHYYAHKGEPDLGQCINQWPTPNILSRKGVNGVAQREIGRVLALVEQDIGGKQNIGTLQQEVLRPLVGQMMELEDFC